jgi:DNA-directed RNA polymerase beta' subunit
MAIRLKIRNWDKDCKMDLISGDGFHITEPATKKKDRKTIKNENGSHSSRFGSDYMGEDVSGRYSCTCGAIKGKVFEGETCPQCKSKIVFKEVDLSMTGWIILDEYYIIQPLMYKKLESIIGTKVFNDIIIFNKMMSIDGTLTTDESKGPFYGIGLIEFKERFDEILAYYKNKMRSKPNKIIAIEEIEDNKDCVFTHSIPVYSSILRPLGFNDENFSYTKLDKKLNSVFSLSQLLNNSNVLEKRRKGWNKDKRMRMNLPNILSNIQLKVMETWQLIFEELDNKDGHIRSDIMGGMVNYSGRCVIIPDPTLRADEIILNYMCFLELYKFEIISCLVKIEQTTENVAFDKWCKARVKYSKKIHEVMRYIIKKHKPKVRLNRNPSINYGSLLVMKVKDVKCENIDGLDGMDDFTMSLPLQILPVTNADFDGDELNIISLKTTELADTYYKASNPVDNMYISSNDGLFNSDFNLYKDQIIGLYQFNNI